MFVDPAVSRAKFDREVTEFRAQKVAHHQRGIWLLEATFPEVFIVLMAVQAAPFQPMAMFGVVINFENYDVEPPSIRFVHPMTRQPLRAMEVTHPMPRYKKALGPDGKQATGPNGQPLIDPAAVPLIQAEHPAKPGFVCLPGVREYHLHPAHTGDSWWLHRGSGEGRLAHLANILATYGIDPVKGPNIQVVFNGFNMNPQL